GCGARDASTEIAAGSVAETAESEYFDQGLCAYTCLKLRECGALCRALGDPPGCNPDDGASYAMCVRGALQASYWGTAACPHACQDYGGRFIGAYRWDAQACGEAVLTRSCDGIYTVFTHPPSECTNVCR